MYRTEKYILQHVGGGHLKKKKSRIEKWRERVDPPQNKLMRQVAAVARRKGLPCPITPEEVRKEKLSG
jgi:hypothetical protein